MIHRPTPPFRWSILALALTWAILNLVFPASAHAGDGYWDSGSNPSSARDTCNPQMLDSLNAYGQCAVAAIDSAEGPLGCGRYYEVNNLVPTGNGYQANLSIRYSYGGGCASDTQQYNMITQIQNVPDCDGYDPLTGCPDEPEVCPVDGLTFIKSGNGTAPAAFCDQGCNFVSDGANIWMGGGWTGHYTANGTCSPDVAESPDTDLNCLSNGYVTYCMDPDTISENCGTINGQYLCLSSVPEGNCYFTADGGAVCAGGSQTNPPDGTLSDLNGNDYDVYNDAGSTGGTSGGGGTSAGSGDGTGSSSGSGTGSGNGTGGEGECPSWENCDETFDGQVPAIDDDGCDFDCITSNFYNSLETGPWGQAVGNVAVTSGGASCPAPSFTVFDTSLTIDAHCNLGEAVRAFLSVVFLGIWAFAATRVVLSA